MDFEEGGLRNLSFQVLIQVEDLSKKLAITIERKKIRFRLIFLECHDFDKGRTIEIRETFWNDVHNVDRIWVYSITRLRHFSLFLYFSRFSSVRKLIYAKMSICFMKFFSCVQRADDEWLFIISRRTGTMSTLRRSKLFLSDQSMLIERSGNTIFRQIVARKSRNRSQKIHFPFENFNFIDIQRGIYAYRKIWKFIYESIY